MAITPVMASEDRNGAERTASIYPTPDEINALPEKVRRHIHVWLAVVTRAETCKTIAILREDREALQRRIEELEGIIKPLIDPKRIV